ncbi:MAG: RNA polymerase sigma factor [Bryobacteraceae bacterium]
MARSTFHTQSQYTEMMTAAVMTDLSRVRNDSFDQVVAEWQVRILRTAYRITGNWADAEDVAQEAFVRLHRHGLGFPNEAALNGWLYRVTVNLCLDHRRARRPAEELPEVRSLADSAEAAAIREQQKQRLLAALTRLAPKERAAIVLREMEGLSTAEVAEVLGSTEGNVRSQISKAMGRLREIMNREQV